MKDFSESMDSPPNSNRESEAEKKAVPCDESKENEGGNKKKEVTVVKKKKKRKSKKQKQPTGEKNVGRKKPEGKPQSSNSMSFKSSFAQIAKELKAKRLAQIAYAAAMAKKRKKNRVLRDEEVYTDKDRAAAVNMGTRDIKQSLKLKKKLDKNHNPQIPDEAEPATLLALGNSEMRSGNLKTALNFMNKALELNPEDKNGLVARSKCYLSLGDPQLALKDAETALTLDKAFVRGIYQKAEALYHLGDFEHSLMYYHRGHRLRPELECFRLGVQKAQEAIENTIGNNAGTNHRKTEKITPPSNSSSAKTGDSNRNEQSSEKSKIETDPKRSLSSFSSDKNTRSSQKRSKSAAPIVKSSSRRFLGELNADRLYLENLLKHPDLVCSNQEASNIIKVQAEEGITFLKNRQEFWRQQKPSPSSKKTKKTEEQKAWSELSAEQ